MKTFFLVVALVVVQLGSVDTFLAILLDRSNRHSDYRQEVAEWVKRLYPTERAGVTYLPESEAREEAFSKLLSIAKRSTKARQYLIQALISVVQDQKAFPETRIDAAWLLGKLRSLESLNILVKYLDLKGIAGSISLTFHPMVSIIVEMGEIAIPYLEKAMNDEKISIREEASLALGEIGGEKAKKVLERALSTETEESVKEAIKWNLNEIRIRSQRKQR